MAPSAVVRLAMVAVASLLLFIAPPLIEARAERRLCEIERIDWRCRAPNVTADLDQDCSAREGRKVFRFLNESLVQDGWRALTTSTVMQEYVRVYVATLLGLETCSWFNRQCIRECAYTCGPCVNRCLTKFRRCQGQDTNDCCRIRRRPCNGTSAHSGGRRLLDDNSDSNIKTVTVKGTSDKAMADEVASQMKTSGSEKGHVCVACATATVPGGSDAPTKQMTCAAAQGEGPKSSTTQDPSSTK